MIDVTTIGAGGGSIAYVDTGGVLKVGPVSAGGRSRTCMLREGGSPHGYGRKRYTRQDRSRLVSSGGRMKIYPGKSRVALRKPADKLKMPIVQLAEGVVRVANANMERALRVISIGRGFDPRDFALISFGGRGGASRVRAGKRYGDKECYIPQGPRCAIGNGDASCRYV